MGRRRHAGTYNGDERGDQPSGREPQGDGAPIGRRESNCTHQGGRESRPQGEGAQATGHQRSREVCVMQTPNGPGRPPWNAGRRGLPCSELYRESVQTGALDSLADGDLRTTSDAPDRRGNRGTGHMTLGKIEAIIDALRRERYREFRPVRCSTSQRRTEQWRSVCHRGRRSSSVSRSLPLEATTSRSSPSTPRSLFLLRLSHRIARGGTHVDGNEPWFIEADISSASTA